MIQEDDAALQEMAAEYGIDTTGMTHDQIKTAIGELKQAEDPE